MYYASEIEPADLCTSQYLDFAGPEPTQSCYAFFEAQATIPEYMGQLGAMGYSFLTPQVNGSLFWVQVLGALGLDYAELNPATAVPEKSRDLVDVDDTGPYLNANSSAPFYHEELNGVWRGTARNSFPPWNPATYEMELNLTVTPGCTRCGVVTYRGGELVAPVTYMAGVNCSPAFVGALPTHACWQFYEDYTAEGAVGDPGPAQFWIAPWVLTKQTDGTLMWSALQFDAAVATASLHR